MDNFMEKVAHRFDSSDMIRANAQAEAAELDQTREQLVRFESQMEKVDGALTDLRQVNMKNVETAEELRSIARESGEKIGAEAAKLGTTSERIGETAQKLGLSTVRLGESAEKLSESTEKIDVAAQKLDSTTEKLGAAFDSVKDESLSRIKETSELSIAGINKTIDESLAKIAEIQDSSDSTEELGEIVNGLSEKLDTLHKQLEEFAHTDHVKIYRNVQASFVEELGKQTEELKGSMPKKGAAVPLIIVDLVFTVLTFAFLLLNWFGLL
ncbi:MAG: hypothetical protein K6F53_02740 [Lachnospiraceae bacterium]|nr:hypothetical protein [Lachnospiraceae bacterium]